MLPNLFPDADEYLFGEDFAVDMDASILKWNMDQAKSDGDRWRLMMRGHALNQLPTAAATGSKRNPDWMIPNDEAQDAGIDNTKPPKVTPRSYGRGMRLPDPRERL